MPTNMNDLHKYQPPVKVTTDLKGRVLFEEPLSMDAIAAEDDYNYETALRGTIDFVTLCGSSTMRKADDNGGLEQVFSEAGVPDIPDFIMAHLFLQWIGAREDADCTDLNREGKAAALEFAEVLGTDHAQALYRFAVLVTKLG